MARSFDNTDDEIDFTPATGFPTTGSFTVCTILNRKTDEQGVILWVGVTSGGWLCVIDGSTLKFIKRGVATVASGLTVNASTWYLAVWRHRATVEVEFDLIPLDGSAPSNVIIANTSGINTPSGDAAFGKQLTGAISWYGGLLATCVVYSSALTDTELDAIGRGMIMASFNRTDLVGLWPMWGVSSPEPDLSGKQQNGTVVGATLAGHAPVGPYVMPFSPRGIG